MDGGEFRDYANTASPRDIHRTRETPGLGL
jgi:hypothetical protein